MGSSSSVPSKDSGRSTCFWLLDPGDRSEVRKSYSVIFCLQHLWTKVTSLYIYIYMRSMFVYCCPFLLSIFVVHPLVNKGYIIIYLCIHAKSNYRPIYIYKKIYICIRSICLFIVLNLFGQQYFLLSYRQCIWRPQYSPCLMDDY